jgi:hypothetical protein
MPPTWTEGSAPSVTPVTKIADILHWTYPAKIPNRISVVVFVQNLE